jgi:hypothetical protein
VAEIREGRSNTIVQGQRKVEKMARDENKGGDSGRGAGRERRGRLEGSEKGSKKQRWGAMGREELTAEGSDEDEKDK